MKVKITIEFECQEICDEDLNAECDNLSNEFFESDLYNLQHCKVSWKKVESKTKKEDSINSESENATKCILCGCIFDEYGNNPSPLADPSDSCCDDCNMNKVIPARLKKIKR